MIIYTPVFAVCSASSRRPVSGVWRTGVQRPGASAITLQLGRGMATQLSNTSDHEHYIFYLPSSVESHMSKWQKVDYGPIFCLWEMSAIRLVSPGQWRTNGDSGEVWASARTRRGKNWLLISPHVYRMVGARVGYLLGCFVWLPPPSHHQTRHLARSFFVLSLHTDTGSGGHPFLPSLIRFNLKEEFKFNNNCQSGFYLSFSLSHPWKHFMGKK